jgi:uncharacterized sulfatase
LRQAVREQALRIRDAGFLPEAEMHKRAASTTIYEMARDPAKYPLERILDTADLATSPRAGDLPKLKEAISDSDSAVRYWAALGLRIRGADAVSGAHDSLLAALNDSSASVRVAAAAALGLHGTAADKKAAWSALQQLAPPQANGAYVSLAALNAIDQVGPQRPAEVTETLRTMPLKDPGVPARANGYVARLVEYLTGRVESPSTAPPRAAGAAKKPLSSR